MAKTLNGKSPRAQQRAQELIMDRAVLRYRGRIASEIARAMRQASKNIKGSKKAQLALHKKNLLIILKPLWKSSAADSIENNVGGKKSLSVFGMELKVDVEKTPNIDKIISEWLNLYSSRKITEIASTTQSDIAGIVALGRKNGLTEIEIGKQIRDIAPTKSASRAQTIARTESHQASNVAAMSAAKVSGVKMKKQWVASSGERTREDHDAADGQTVKMDDDFIVGGEPLSFPGDPKGSAKNVINCRCAVIFVFE